MEIFTLVEPLNTCPNVGEMNDNEFAECCFVRI